MAAKKTGLVRSDGKEVIAYMGGVIACALERHGNEKREAREIALDVMERMRKEMGGQNIYFPKGIAIDLDAKCAGVYEKFMSGSEIHELAHEYGHSIQWIYTMIRSERLRRKAKRDAAEKVAKEKEQERWRRES